MSSGTSAKEIDAVDAFALALFRRAKQSGTDFQDTATLVRRLHTVLKHLRVEAEDPDSLLNSKHAAVYNRQLTPVVEDCEFTLKQLDTILLRHGGESGPMTSQERDMVEVIKKKLAEQKTTIDLFLDTVQLQNPSKTRHVMETMAEGPDGNLDAIKDKVDAIATRLFSRRDSGYSEDGNDLWQQFRSELEREGFSRDVLSDNKEVLRAYIRELESSGISEGGPPSVRGLLEHERNYSTDPSLSITPAHYDRREDFSPKEMYPSIDNEKFIPDVKSARRMPQDQPLILPNRDTALSYDRQSTDDDASPVDSNNAMALISTRDLMDLDLTGRMSGMHLAPMSPRYSISPSSSPSTRYLPPIVAGALPAPPSTELATSPGSQLTSPRFVPSLPPYSPNGSTPPPYSDRRSARLAPDSQGQEIPLDAKWTRIKRTLVSPEVLDRAGVRYEARPDYVAVLGRLTRDEIAEYARQSADARAARSFQPRHRSNDRPPYPVSDSSSESDEIWDESDTTEDERDRDPKREKGDGRDRFSDDKGTKSYPVIVNPPSLGKSGASPASTVPPKPILKNRNENRVRFDPEPHEVSTDDLGKSPRSLRDRDTDKEREKRRRRRDRDRDGPRDRDRDRDREHHHRRHREERDREKDREPRRHHSRTEREREKDRDRREDRNTKKKAWGETAKAVGIGGAAASLLSVLTEAAAGL